MMSRIFLSCLLLLAVAAGNTVFAQDNYEVQVYGSKLTPRGYTMFELHSNYAAKGLPAETSDGVPSNHSIRETLEITTGINSWMEVGFYVFTNYHDGKGYQWVGDHIRPRFTAPEKWNIPVGLSLSLEGGYQRKEYSPNTFNAEIRPIVDETMGNVYLSFNPTLDVSFKGPDKGKGYIFSPNVKASYTFAKVFSMGIEYYGALGAFNSFEPYAMQQHMLVPSLDLNFSQDWEFNCGIGFGITNVTEPLLFKFIVGRRINFFNKK